jgi:hypothetical protein
MNEAGQLELLRSVFPSFKNEYNALPHEPTGIPHEFHFNNDFFDGTDALVLYCMVRHFKPRRIIESGSGYSTRVSAMARAGAKFVHTDSHEIFVSTEDGQLKEISRRSLNKGVITDKTLWYISHINAVHERELLDKSGLYDPKMPFFIDWDMFQRLAKQAKPHHLGIYTCEHYMYLNKEKKESNTISSAHKKDPELSKRMHLEMFKRSFSLLSADDFAEFVRDWQSKTSQLEEKTKALRETEKKLIEKTETVEDMEKRVVALLNSLSWKITAPLRFVFDKLTRKG